MNAPENKSRFRRLTIIHFDWRVGDMTFSIAILFVQMTTKFANFYGVTVITAGTDFRHDWGRAGLLIAEKRLIVDFNSSLIKYNL
ncbi:MAG: hypothetical protein IPL71_07900 [Anaerolineales bacterium]|uniref:hypothetical protein n=1 Tax=Candidatus Villigracilis proximus TaxID=3140683 RepID=UPI0031371574|nr:hypothetical protein [Anaerolineales bacterium]